MSPSTDNFADTCVYVYTVAAAVISVCAADKKTIACSYDLGSGARAVNQIAYTKHLKNVSRAFQNCWDGEEGGEICLNIFLWPTITTCVLR